MVVLDDDGTSSGDSSSTLMDSLSKKDKGKVIGSFLRGDKSRVLQIGDYLNDVGEDEIESVFEATKRGRVGLDHGGTNLAKNPNAHGRSLDGGLACAGIGVGSDGAGRSVCCGTRRTSCCGTRWTACWAKQRTGRGLGCSSVGRPRHWVLHGL